MPTRDYNLVESGIADLIKSGDCRAMLITDSTGTPNTIADSDSQQATLYQTIYRQWSSLVTWKGIVFGGTSGQGLNQVNPHASVSTTVRAPDDAHTNGDTQFKGMPRQDNVFGATVADNTALLGNRVIPGGTPAKNPFAAAFADREVTCWALCRVHNLGTGGAASVKFQTRRVDSGGGSPSIKNTTAGQALAGSPGTAYFEAICPVHGSAGKEYPDHRLLMDGTQTTGQDANTIVTGMRDDALATGFQLASFGVGGAGTGNWLDPDDPDAAGTGGQRAFIHDTTLEDVVAATQTNLFVIFLSANDGTYDTNWRRRYEKVIERCAAAADANSIEAKFLLITQHACNNLSKAKSDQHWAAIENIRDSGGTASHGTLDGVVYAVVPWSRIAAINLRLAHAARGAISGEVDADGVWVSGPNNGASGTGTYMFDHIHRTRLGADYDAETIAQVIHSPTPEGSRHKRVRRLIGSGVIR